MDQFLGGRSHLIFEDRKIVLKIKGSTAELSKVFLLITTALKEILDKPSIEFDNPILLTEQTESIAQLDVNFTLVFSNKLRRFMKNNLAKKLSYKPEKILPGHVSIDITFNQPKDLYYGQRVSISPKSFTMEPRADTKPEDKIFCSSSPFSSDLHIGLLKEFEELFKK